MPPAASLAKKARSTAPGMRRCFTAATHDASIPASQARAGRRRQGLRPRSPGTGRSARARPVHPGDIAGRMIRSTGQRAAVGAHLARRRIDAAVAAHAMLDTLVAAEAAVRLADPPAEIGERLAGARGNPGFEPEQPGRAEARRILAHRFRRAFVMPARAIPGGLDLEPVIDAIDDDLRLPLRLHVATHHPERQPRPAVLRREAGDDRLE